MKALKSAILPTPKWAVVDFSDFNYTKLSYLVLLVTFNQIEMEMPDWAHSKDLFKIFLTITNFL